MRVGQEAAVDDEVGVDRKPVLVAERHHGRAQTRLVDVGERGDDFRPQLVHVEPGGVEHQVGLTSDVAEQLAFARDARSPSVGFATCQQHFPENFWNRAFQTHPNGATGVVGVVLVAENPTDHHIFVSAFTGERELLATSTGITVKTARGEIQVMAPDAFRSHFGVPPPDVAHGMRIAALRFAIRDTAAVEVLLRDAGIAARRIMGRLVVGPAQAMGATLVFEPAA